MGKRGRTPAASKDKILDELIKHELIENNKLKKKSDHVWKDVCEGLDNAVKPIYMYFKVFKDECNIKTSYLERKGFPKDFLDENIVNKKDNSTEALEESESDKKCDSENGNKERKKTKFSGKKVGAEIGFKINIDNTAWNKMKPLDTSDENRENRKVLKSSWTDIIAEAIYMESKLPCVYAFKKHIVNENNFEYYIKIEGACVECKADININGPLPNSANPQNYVLDVVTRNTIGISHIKKRKLVGEKRNIIKNELKIEKPKEWRMRQAALTMKYGDIESPFLYDLRSLQKARQEIKNDELGIDNRSSLFESLSNIKRIPKYNKYIREI